MSMVRLSIRVEIFILIGGVLEMMHALTVGDVLCSVVDLNDISANFEESFLWQLDLMAFKNVSVFLWGDLFAIDEETVDAWTLKINEHISVDLTQRKRSCLNAVEDLGTLVHSNSELVRNIRDNCSTSDCLLLGQDLVFVIFSVGPPATEVLWLCGQLRWLGVPAAGNIDAASD